ncbi:MAG TPA: glycosyltransferase [Candidatus Paceibacterota bacterium]|nr:glycosyltransferase [Candidatus Paceibacterota bacterium]
MPNISVLLCAYQETIEEFEIAVRSVVLQTLRPKQLVIVDDSGESRFLSRCQILQETLLAKTGVELTYVENKVNLGLVASLNLGLARVSGDYVARMDADDISLPYRFRKQVELLESGFGITGGGITLFNDAGLLRDVHYPATRFGVLYSFLFNNPIAHPVSMFKTEVISRLQGYQQVDYAEDLDLWMRAYLGGDRITNCRSILLLRRVHAKQLSSKHSSEQRRSTQQLRRLFRKHFFRL